MTSKEAINLIRTQHDLYDVVAGDWSFASKAIEALEKQIPMEHHHSKCVNIEGCRVRESICPNCLAIVSTNGNEYPKYCSECGQAIDWSDVGVKFEEDDIISRLIPICCPDSGSFIAWKKAHGKIVKLEVCEDALRSSAFDRKCRCSKAFVLKIENFDGSDSGLTEVSSDYDEDFVYRIGDIVEVKNFDTNRMNECAPGIHFFITRNEAVDYTPLT